MNQIFYLDKNYIEENMEICIIGATGLVGNHLLSKLKADDKITKIHAIARQEISGEKIQHYKLNEFHKIPNNVNWFVSCLGTTIKNAKSPQAFYDIDYNLNLEFALKAKNTNANFMIISSQGANSKSNFLYTKTKGELEDSLIKLDFNKLVIFRPSLLIGNRNEKRTLENIGIMTHKLLSPILPKKISKKMGTSVECLANKMLSQLHSSPKTEKQIVFINPDQI